LLQKNQDQRLAAYVVWVPELGAQEKNVGPATVLVPDRRASQFWDPREVVGTNYGRLLGINYPAWDVYMLFRPGIIWRGDTPPKPDFWMHQLGGVTNAPRLDPVEFAHQADRLLKQQT
jgi:hypothetical protein